MHTRITNNREYAYPFHFKGLGSSLNEALDRMDRNLSTLLSPPHLGPTLSPTKATFPSGDQTLGFQTYYGRTTGTFLLIPDTNMTGRHSNQSRSYA